MDRMNLFLIGGVIIGLTMILFGVFVYAELDFDLKPSFENGLFTIGYGYTCGKSYQNASGITTLTLSRTEDMGWTSVIKYYDSDYDLVSESFFHGSKAAILGVYQYWNDKELSNGC